LFEKLLFNKYAEPLGLTEIEAHMIFASAFQESEPINIERAYAYGAALIVNVRLVGSTKNNYSA